MLVETLRTLFMCSLLVWFPSSFCFIIYSLTHCPSISCIIFNIPGRWKRPSNCITSCKLHFVIDISKVDFNLTRNLKNSFNISLGGLYAMYTWITYRNLHLLSVWIKLTTCYGIHPKINFKINKMMTPGVSKYTGYI